MKKRKSIGLWVGICLLFLGIFGSVNVFAAVTEGKAGEILTGEYAVIINTDTSDSRSAGTLIFDDSGSTASASSGSELPAAFAAVDNCPFAAFAHPDGNRLHDAAAVGCAVARLFVYMKTRQAVGAMVAVPTARILRRTQPTADFAGKAVSTIMGFIVTFFKSFAFVFTVHVVILLKFCGKATSGGMACGCSQTSRSAHKLPCK